MFNLNKSFKNENSFDQRLQEATRVINKYPDRIPIIVERSKKADNSCPLIDKNKYLVPRDLTVGQFIYVIRKRLQFPSEKAIFLFINNQIAPSSKMMGEIYEKNRETDYFLYCSYSYENTFG